MGKRESLEALLASFDQLGFRFAKAAKGGEPAAINYISDICRRAREADIVGGIFFMNAYAFLTSAYKGAFQQEYLPGAEAARQLGLVAGELIASGESAARARIEGFSERARTSGLDVQSDAEVLRSVFRGAYAPEQKE